MIQLITTVVQKFAAVNDPCNFNSGPTNFIIPTWYKYLKGVENDASKCIVKYDLPADISRVLLACVEILLRLGGLVAVAFVIYGGFNYITSQGQPENTKSARQTIINALIGVVITTIATVIVSFIGREFIK